MSTKLNCGYAKHLNFNIIKIGIWNTKIPVFVIYFNFINLYISEEQLKQKNS